jgi:hypothetical protein
VLIINPPIFFKYVATFVRIASVVSKNIVNQTLNILYEAEKNIKKGSSIELLESLCFEQYELIKLNAKR